jgi:hypothetical protein
MIVVAVFGGLFAFSMLDARLHPAVFADSKSHSNPYLAA